MNILIFELKAQWKSVLTWTLSMILILGVFQIGMYPAFTGSRYQFIEIIEGYPEVFLTAFGFDIDTMFSFGGFFNITFNYLSLMSTILAMLISVSIFSREKRSKCVDFLLSKPLSRSSIFVSKSMAVFTLIICSNILLLISSVVIYTKSGEPIEKIVTFIICISGLFFIQIVFSAIGIAFAVFMKKIRSISGIATAVGFSAFILSTLYAIFDDEAMRYIAPLKYFNPSTVYNKGGFEIQYVFTAIVITMVCIGSAYVAFCKHDAHSV